MTLGYGRVDVTEAGWAFLALVACLPRESRLFDDVDSLLGGGGSAVSASNNSRDDWKEDISPGRR